MIPGAMQIPLDQGLCGVLNGGVGVDKVSDHPSETSVPFIGLLLYDELDRSLGL
jgi:hypothetical protein